MVGVHLCGVACHVGCSSSHMSCHLKSSEEHARCQPRWLQNTFKTSQPCQDSAWATTARRQGRGKVQTHPGRLPSIGLAGGGFLPLPPAGTGGTGGQCRCARRCSAPCLHSSVPAVAAPSHIPTPLLAGPPAQPPALWQRPGGAGCELVSSFSWAAAYPGCIQTWPCSSDCKYSFPKEHWPRLLLPKTTQLFCRRCSTSQSFWCAE